MTDATLAILRKYQNDERMLRALTHPTYRRLFAAQVVALAGTGLATVALGLLAYDLAAADAGVVLGAVFAVKMVAYVLVAPVASAVLARFPRSRVMVSADLVRLAAALLLPFVDSVWQVFVLVFVLQAASATFTPTFQSVIPETLPDEEDYTSALSLSRLAYDLEAVLSPMLAGLLLLAVSSSTLFFGTAAGFFGSALLVVSAALPGRAEVGRSEVGRAGLGRAGLPQKSATPLPPLRERTRRGLVLFVTTGPLRSVMALNLAVAAAGAFVLVQTVVIVRETFSGGAALVPLALAANGLGSMGAALLLPRVLRRWSERRVMLVGSGLLVVGMALVPLALRAGPTAGLLAVCVLWVVVGVGWSSVETPVGRLVRRYVPPADLPAAFAAQFSLSHACWLLTYPLAGWLGGLSLSATACSLGVVALGATVVAARLWGTGTTVPAGIAAREDVGTTT